MLAGGALASFSRWRTSERMWLRVVRAGVVRTHQIVRPFRDMTVLDNVRDPGRVVLDGPAPAPAEFLAGHGFYAIAEGLTRYFEACRGGGSNA